MLLCLSSSRDEIRINVAVAATFSWHQFQSKGYGGGKTMNNELICSDPAIMMGKPVIAGTRITVELILDRLGSGETMDDVLQAYPKLTRQDVLAAIRFGAQALRADVAYPVAEVFA